MLETRRGRDKETKLNYSKTNKPRHIAFVSKHWVHLYVSACPLTLSLISKSNLQLILKLLTQIINLTKCTVNKKVN